MASIEHVPTLPLATSTDIDLLVEPSIALVNILITESEKLRSREDEVNRRRFSRLLKDSSAVALTMSLTDEIMRISFMSQAARTLRRSARLATATGLGRFDYIGIKLASITSHVFPRLVMRIVHLRIRRAATGIILPSEKELLSKHIQMRKKLGMRLNINLLGEAVLGEHEAKARLQSIIELVQRPEISYASVKISSIVSQLISIDHAGSVSRASENLRLLYRQAQESNVFINLDMEEFRDLRITVDVFKSLLSEVEFSAMDAGIVLQAYLPESHAVFAELAEWSLERYNKTGATIKIRLVKGANLAMEKAEAELHGWVGAPYSTKPDVDASYARLIDAALRPEYSKAVRIGIASHNLFHIAWAIEVAKARGVDEQLDIEMLEGMANAEALSVAALTGNVLLYTPVTRHQDFPTAVAYLVRRLDENTSKENYLRSSFDMQVGNKEFMDQQTRFLASVSQRHSISTLSRRHTMVLDDAHQKFLQGVFINESDADPTNPVMAKKLHDEFSHQYSVTELEIPLVIDGTEAFTPETEFGIDPSDDGAIWYRYCVAQMNDVDTAVQSAGLAFSQWSNRDVQERAQILADAALLMQSQRARTIAVMSRDAGKTFTEADPEVSEAIDFARFYALSAITKEVDSTALGVVLVVPPWNFPYAIVAGGVCAALASGNAVILKPAPETVATSWLLVNQLWESGVPREVLQFLPTRDDEVGKYLVTHTGVDAVILTGAFETAIMFTQWKPEIHLMAETSGKNAILISASADIDNAVKDLVQSAFGHAGQKCSAASLAIVDSSVYNDPAFRNQLRDAVESLTIGFGRDFSTAVGPIIHPPQGALERALTILDPGESWLVAPRQIDESGYLWSPGVKFGVTPDSWSFEHEWFGPVLGVIEAPDFDSALDMQNRGDYGLTAGLHSLDVQECEKWIDGVQAGNLYVNRGITGAVVNRQPFGGWKRSSVGATSKAGGANYLSNLRNWQAFTSLQASKEAATAWWDTVGSKSLDMSELKVERNYQRYRAYGNVVAICCDEDVDVQIREYITWISDLVGTPIRWCAPDDVIINCDKVRWLSEQRPPVVELLARGITVDSRPVAARADVELPRWLHEQSVSIVNHRYGNVGAGPHPQLR